ncbi:hypothetical protein MIND_01236200 [Mycena indigotica]|uniref:Uncharacterized protein n=1 Tax=Mycena indigotica TaxID=2126181 RepID=A0A8H6VS87_9AGAR|nr:uncharacterized protein MIND_01236200 [Mycena indigotica]KAF7292097.1 hypothetical protein MIND_01236200 [Mycena indigotica]
MMTCCQHIVLLSPPPPRILVARPSPQIPMVNAGNLFSGAFHCAALARWTSTLRGNLCLDAEMLFYLVVAASSPRQRYHVLRTRGDGASLCRIRRLRFAARGLRCHAALRSTWSLFESLCAHACRDPDQ